MLLRNFNYWIEVAQSDLAERANLVFPETRASCLRMAEDAMVRALRAANKMQDNARKALCMRVLNWLRADLRRAQS